MTTILLFAIGLFGIAVIGLPLLFVFADNVNNLMLTPHHHETKKHVFILRKDGHDTQYSCPPNKLNDDGTCYDCGARMGRAGGDMTRDRRDTIMIAITASIIMAVVPLAAALALDFLLDWLVSTP